MTISYETNTLLSYHNEVTHGMSRLSSPNGSAEKATILLFLISIGKGLAI